MTDAACALSAQMHVSIHLQPVATIDWVLLKCGGVQGAAFTRTLPLAGAA